MTEIVALMGATGSLLFNSVIRAIGKQFKDVRGDIQVLVEHIHAFLLAMENVEDPDEQTKLRVRHVRELSYTIVDIIDKFKVHLDCESHPKARGLGLIDKCKKRIRDIKIRREIAKELKDIETQIKELISVATEMTTDKHKMLEDDFHSPSAQMMLATEITIDEHKVNQEDCTSTSTEIMSATGTVADARRMRVPPLSWDEVPLDIDHLVLQHVPSFYDRCRLRCVSPRWLQATSLCSLPPRPLPMVINADFTLLNCFADGPLAEAWTIKLPANVLDEHHIACVGCFDDWMICVYPRAWDPSQSLMLCDQRCYVLNPSKELLYLPDPPAFQTNRRLHDFQVQNSSSAISFTRPASALDITLSKVVLTASPDIGNWKAAAISESRGQRQIALSMLSMSSWCLCTADFITAGTDLEFFEESLYLLVNENADLYVLEFGPQFCFFPEVTRAERCLINPLPDLSNNGVHMCNLVKSNKKLLLVVRQFSGVGEQMTEVQVYILDKKTKPWKWVKLSSLDGYCILISSAHNSSYPAYLYDEIEEETIYFLDSMNREYLPREGEKFTYRVLVYNLLNGTISFRMIGSKPSRPAIKFPVWYCPSH